MWKACVLFIIALAVCGIHSGDAEEVTVCEGKEQTIGCQGDQVLEIMAADYGRSDDYTCKGRWDILWNTDCLSDDALDVTKSECEGLQSCVLHAANSEYGDPCPLTKKYLTVSYRCVTGRPSDVERIRACENERLSIRCPNKRKINVVFANYGRLKGAHICGGIAWDTDCGASNSLSVVKDACQGERSCELEASGTNFGDPCWLTKKYLEVQYECKKRI